MAKRRLGTIQSFRPGYARLMPELSPYGKPSASFQRLVGFSETEHLPFRENGTGSRARTYDLRFWRPPLYQLSYARTRALLFHKADENSSALLRRGDPRRRSRRDKPQRPGADEKFEPESPVQDETQDPIAIGGGNRHEFEGVPIKWHQLRYGRRHRVQDHMQHGTREEDADQRRTGPAEQSGGG